MIEWSEWACTKNDKQQNCLSERDNSDIKLTFFIAKAGAWSTEKRRMRESKRKIECFPDHILLTKLSPKY